MNNIKFSFNRYSIKKESDEIEERQRKFYKKHHPDEHSPQIIQDQWAALEKEKEEKDDEFEEVFG